MSTVVALAPVRQRPRSRAQPHPQQPPQPQQQRNLSDWLAEERRLGNLPDHTAKYAALYLQERALLDVAGRALHTAYNRLAEKYEGELRTVQFIYNHTLDRHWVSRLAPARYALVRFIYDRTMGWPKKISEVITLGQITRGMLTEEGERRFADGRTRWPDYADYLLDKRGIPVRAGLRMSKDTAMTQLGGLVHTQAVHRIEWGTSGNLHHAYRLQLDWAGVLAALRCYAGASDHAQNKFVANVIRMGEIMPDHLVGLWPYMEAN